MVVEYESGKNNKAADALSRINEDKDSGSIFAISEPVANRTGVKKGVPQR